MTPFAIFGIVSAIFASLFCPLCLIRLIDTIVSAKSLKEKNEISIFLFWVILFVFSLIWYITAIFLIIA